MKIKPIKKRSEFLEILSGGRRQKEKSLTLYWRPSPSEGLFVGVIAAKRNVPKAVHRNYIKRVIYAFFRKTALPIKGAVMVFRVTNNPMSGGGDHYGEICGNIEKLISKAGLA